MNEITVDAAALHVGDETHCIECGSPKPCATASIFAGPSSVADYEALGAEVCSTCHQSFDALGCIPGLDGKPCHTSGGGCAAVELLGTPVEDKQ